MLLTEMTNEELKCEIIRLQQQYVQKVTELIGVATKLKKTALGKPCKGGEYIEDLQNRLGALAYELVGQYCEVLAALGEDENRWILTHHSHTGQQV
jgi:hypothetical protein